MTGRRVRSGGIFLAMAMVLAGFSQISRPQAAAAAPGAITSVDLAQVGFTNLASLGLDGQTKPRGQNGDVAVLGNNAYVGGGALFHGAQSTVGRICTDYGGVKVVNIANPAAPTVTNTIRVDDYKTVLSGPVGNPRRGQTVHNVAASVSAVDVFRHPVLNKDILAIATQRCEPSFFNGARVEFWDVTTPTAPVRLQIFDGPLDPATGQPMEWGIYEEVRMFSRNNGPGGSTKVYATATTPFSVGNAHNAIGNGDFRLIDITDMSVRPVQVANFPTASIGQSSNNGCRTFQAGRNAVPTPDKSSVIFSDYDGAQPPDSPIEPTGLPDPGRSAAVMKLDLDNLPVFDQNPAGQLRTFTPKPKTWGYPPAPNGGMTAAGTVEGNAADVAPFTGPDGHLNTVVSEDDLSAALTNVHFDSPGGLFPDSRGCETTIGKHLYELPGQQVAGDVVYVGRGCPASTLANDTLTAEDPYLANPAGKIALLESGGGTGCTAADKVKRAAAAGATAAVANLGCCLSQFILGPDGPIPTIPFVGVRQDAFNATAGYVPSRILSGVNYPLAYQRTTTTNVTSKPFALAVTAATNASPIQITTATHGLTTGDKVTISGVTGNTGANGNWTVTVVSATTFTLNGSTGTGAFTGGGIVRPCPLSDPGCASVPTRTDFSRIRSTANATDRVAGGNVNASVITTTADAAPAPPTPVGGSTPNVTIPVAPLTADLNLGTILYFANGVRAPLAASAAAGATSIMVGGSSDDFTGPIPSGTKGSPAFPVVAGRSYDLGFNVEVDASTSGSFSVDVEWFDAAGASLGQTNLATLSALAPRARVSQTVVAPAGAARSAVKFGWSGAAAEGNAYVDTFSSTPNAMQATLKDHPGECPGLTSWPPTPAQCGTPQAQWGSQRIIDFTANPPTQVARYRSPTSQAWPPPDSGLYAPRQARMFGNDVAFSSWLSDGLRVVDVKNPASPVERASFVPPGVADPTPGAGTGPTNRADGMPLVRGPSWPDKTLLNGVDIKPTGPDTGYVVVSDINAGLYVLSFKVNRVPSTPFDFTGDAKADLSVFRPSGGTWFVRGGTPEALNYGVGTDAPVAADYDGDGKTDIAIFRPSTGLWSVHRSSDGGDTALTYGVSTDIPVPNDYDGDGKADIAVYRPSVGTWYVHQSSNNVDIATTFGGISGDVPVPGDYDGDGKADLAIFRPNGSTWFVHQSSNNADIGVAYGGSGDVPLPADYDNDKKTDFAIFRKPTGLWSIHPSSGGPDLAVTYGGISGDVAVPADYDGDGKADITIYRPSLGTWYVHQTSNNADVFTNYGVSTDKVVPLPFAIRRVFYP